MKKSSKSIRFLLTLPAIAVIAIILTPSPAHAHSGGGIPGLILMLIIWYPYIGLPILAIVIFIIYILYKKISRKISNADNPDKYKARTMPD